MIFSFHHVNSLLLSAFLFALCGLHRPAGSVSLEYEVSVTLGDFFSLGPKKSQGTSSWLLITGSTHVSVWIQPHMLGFSEDRPHPLVALDPGVGRRRCSSPWTRLKPHFLVERHRAFQIPEVALREQTCSLTANSQPQCSPQPGPDSQMLLWPFLGLNGLGPASCLGLGFSKYPLGLQGLRPC